MTILIKELSNEEFQVTVNAKNPTSHNVTLTDYTHQNLTKGKAYTYVVCAIIIFVIVLFLIYLF